MKNAIIFSVFSDAYSLTINRFRHALVKRYLRTHGVNFNETKGAYKGEYEEGFILSPTDIVHARMLCFTYGQECFLEVDDYSRATLEYRDGRRESIGYMQQIHKPDGKNYTFDTLTNTC